uniref:Putative DNA methyltransferase n=1 Tax=Caulerpa okamurae TaxID=118247 RepID=A0A3S5FWU1_9CHLO|nr:putative DNA methyltransferase [Caulerpa okamurae]
MNNKLIDFISGIEVSATPEEREAVQVFSKQLVEDYGYSKEQIITHPQFRVKSRPSDNKGQYPVDIAVFRTIQKKEDDLYIIVECKKKNRRDGKSQLEDYLKLSKSKLGVWFNGSEKVFLRKIEKNGQIYFDEIPNIPKVDQEIEDIGRFKRKDLKPTSNIQIIFKSIRNHLAGNTVGVTRDEMLAQQMINLIFCKLYDERFTHPDNPIKFRVGVNESPKEVENRIMALFQKVKQTQKDVFTENDEIIMDRNSIVYVVGELQNYSLMNSNRDVITDAFETFIGHTLKGSQGQFFTPRNVVKMIVEILNPNENDKILDPACGSGGFLLESLKFVWNKMSSQYFELGWSDIQIEKKKFEVATSNFKGIDKDFFLVKVAKAYMNLMGDGKTGIFCEDGLENPQNWASQTYSQIQLGEFDLLMTNPPFGSKISVTGEAKLKEFQLGYKWKQNPGDSKFYKTQTIAQKTPPQELFIERCLQMLKTGGKMAIILPESYLHAPSKKYVLQYLTEKNNIQTIIDLPQNTFRPFCGVKTCLVIVQKNQCQQKNIMMGVVEQVGQDHKGDLIYRFNKNKATFTTEIWDDTLLIRKELALKNSLAEGNTIASKSRKYLFYVSSNSIIKNYYIPRYYWNLKIEEAKIKAKAMNMSLMPLGELLEKNILVSYKGHGSPPSRYKGRGTVPYIRVADIGNWDIYKNPTSRIPYNIYKSTKGVNGVDLQEKDILFVRRGSYRIGSVAILSPFDKEVLLTSEITVLRVNNNNIGLTAYYLLFALSHEITQMQINNKVFVDTTLTNIGERWKELEIPIFSEIEKMNHISDSVADIIQNKWKSVESLQQIQNNFGRLNF